MNILYSLQHLGYVIPPPADAGWSGRPVRDRAISTRSQVVQRMTSPTATPWNLLHLARMLKDGGGMPAHGNQRSGWDAGCRFGFQNPEHR
jgi:hypothetical protein